MSDRLKDLQRQRALAQEQLAWIDREIAKETGQLPAVSELIATPSTPAPQPEVQRVLAPNALSAAEEILAQYRKPGTAVVQEAKRGCMLYFIFALGALVIFVVGGYYLYLNLRR